MDANRNAKSREAKTNPPTPSLRRDGPQMNSRRFASSFVPCSRNYGGQDGATGYRFTQIGEKTKREVLNAFPLYYDEKSSNILTRIHVLAKDKIVHNKVAKAAKTNHCRSLVETVLSSWPLCPCCEISGYVVAALPRCDLL
jgi:hypothetical protein